MQPTNAELEILNILWRLGSATVKTVNNELNRAKKVGYTTTLKIMQIMYEKKMLSRQANGRSHIYNPVCGQNEVQSLLVDRLLKTAFGGSGKKLVMQALGSQNTSAEELSEIKAFIHAIETEAKK